MAAIRNQFRRKYEAITEEAEEHGRSTTKARQDLHYSNVEETAQRASNYLVTFNKKRKRTMFIQAVCLMFSVIFFHSPLFLIFVLPPVSLSVYLSLYFTLSRHKGTQIDFEDSWNNQRPWHSKVTFPDKAHTLYNTAIIWLIFWTRRFDTDFIGIKNGVVHVCLGLLFQYR